MAMDDLNRLQAETVKLGGSELLRLDEPGSLWVVERGSVALFAVLWQGGQPSGARRFLFDVGPDGALFGMGPLPDGGQAVIAVGLEDTTLVKLPSGDGRAERELAAEWIERWRRALPGLRTGRTAASEPRLASLHEQVLEQLHREAGRERAEGRRRLDARERHSREATQRAVAELTSVLGTGEEPIAEGSDLFVAAHAVGRAAGLRLRPPAAWEESAAAADPVERIARASHVRARQVVLHDRWWEQDCGPLLCFYRANRQPVALVPGATGRYVLLDAATRARMPVDARVAATIDPGAWVFYRPLPEDAARGLELLRFAMRGRGRDLLLVAGTGVAATLLGMFTPQATAVLVDHAIPDANQLLLWQLGLGLLAAALGSAVFRLSQGIAMMRIETGADAATQAAVWDRLLNLRLSFFRQYSTGDLQSRVTAVSQIRSYLGGTTMRTLFSSVILMLNLGLLLYYSPRLTLVAVGVAAVSAVVTVVSGAMLLRYARTILELRGRFFGLMVQLINGVPKLRVAAAESRAFARWARDYARLLRLELAQRRIQDTVRVVNIGVSTASAIVLFALAAALIRSAGATTLTTGTFLAFNVAYGTFIGAIVSLSNTVTDVMAIAILRDRARPILEAVPEVNERKASPGRLRGSVELDHVVFQYHDNGPVILDDVSARIEPGQFIALVGPSGSGKSTLFRLLLGFETPQSGGIYYDGQDLAGLDVHAVRRQMGVVLQNGRINAGSMFDNVTNGAPVALNDAWEAARAAGFAEEIEAMPMGMHTVVSEGGTNLSGGQRQRLLLTRALVHRPGILLLDEATSALDNRTQAVVSDSLRRLNVTRIVIAHRLSTIRNADRIHVIDSGRFVECGKFEDLMARQGLFARLMARQMA